MQQAYNKMLKIILRKKQNMTSVGAYWEGSSLKNLRFLRSKIFNQFLSKKLVLSLSDWNRRLIQTVVEDVYGKKFRLNSKGTFSGVRWYIGNSMLWSRGYMIVGFQYLERRVTHLCMILVFFIRIMHMKFKNHRCSINYLIWKLILYSL